MRSSVRRCAVGIIVALVCAAGSAYGAGWSAPVPGCEVITAYGAVYSGKTHRGVDLRAPAGTDASTPAAGKVTFAGRVPADGGGTCGAVTVEIADGLRVSLLPLAEVFVVAGDALAAGEVVGTVAGSGDDSASTPHLHLGLRRGDVYLDPTGLLPVSEGIAPPIGPVSPPVMPEAPSQGGPSGNEAALGDAPAASASGAPDASLCTQDGPLPTADVTAENPVADGATGPVAASAAAGASVAPASGRMPTTDGHGSSPYAGVSVAPGGGGHRQLVRSAGVLPASDLMIGDGGHAGARSCATGTPVPAGSAAALLGVAALSTAAVCGLRDRMLAARAQA